MMVKNFFILQLGVKMIGGLFEHKYNILTGRYFNQCHLLPYKTNTDKMTASDYTHLFGYLNPYYRSAYNVSKRRK